MASKRIKGITIEIGADTTKLTDEIKEAEKQIGDASYKLRDINKLLKVDPQNVELLTQKQKALMDAIDGTKDKLTQEKQALEQLKNSKQTDEVIAKQEALTREIIETEQKLESLEQEYKEFGSVAKQQAIAAGEAMQETGQKIQGTGRTIANAGRTMTTYVTGPIVAAGTAAVKYASDFDSAMSKVQAISGANAEEMERLEAKAREMGSQTKFSAEESAEALSYMAMAGWKTDQMLNGLEGIMHLAAAAGEDLATTSDIVTDALTAFGLTAEDSARFADILAAAATNSNTNVSMMGESFKYAAAPAGTLGYTAEDVALALGLMANNGIKADMAGTSLRNLFNRMVKPTKESQAAIDQLGIALYDSEGKMYSFREVMLQIRDGLKNIKVPADEAQEMFAALDDQLEAGTITQKEYDSQLEDLTRNVFGAEAAEKARAAAMLGGTRAMSGLLAIANASDEEFDALANSIDTSSNSFAKLADGSVVPLNEALASGQEILEEYSGQAEAMAAIMEDNLGGDITKLKSDLQELAISFGKLMIPEIREMVQELKELIDKVNAMDDEQKQAIIDIAKVVAVLGPLLMVIGNLIIFIGAMVSAIGKIKVAIAGAPAALAAIKAGLASVGAAISTAAGAATSALTTVATVLGTTAGVLLGAIGAVVAAIIVWIKNWDEIKEAAGLFCERTAEHFQELKASLSQTFADVQEAAGLLKERTGEHWEELKAKTSEIWGDIKSTVSEKVEEATAKVKEVFEDLGEFFGGLVEKARTWGSDLIGGIKDGINSGIDGVKQAATNVGNAISARLHFSEPDIGPLSDFNTWMPDMMNQMAQQINAGSPGVASAMQHVAGTMAGAISPDYSGQLASINNGIGQLAAAGGGNITVPVYIGQQKFAQAVVDANRINNYKSGGR